MAAKLPAEVSVVEVGPRDGLQNEPTPLDVADKVALIEALAAAGLRYIEAGSFVNPRWIPQMANSSEVLRSIPRHPGVTYAALTPNQRGFRDALAAGADEVAVFAAASESFSQRNINCSIDESLERFRVVMSEARAAGLKVRGYLSCVLGCPYEGEVSSHAVATVTGKLLELGCYEVSLGDTIGVGTAGSMARLLDELIPAFGPSRLALHCHDTYGQALPNILIGLQRGIARVDSSVAGLGGCPYARGASGNVATEDLVYMLHGMGVRTGIDLAAVMETGRACCISLGRSNRSAVAQALTPVGD